MTPGTRGLAEVFQSVRRLDLGKAQLENLRAAVPERRPMRISRDGAAAELPAKVRERHFLDVP